MVDLMLFTVDGKAIRSPSWVERPAKELAKAVSEAYVGIETFVVLNG
jgi:hypothetical protein